MFHVFDAMEEGYCKIQIRIVDTDVFVLAIMAAQRLKIREVWVTVGTEKNFKYLADP